MAEVDTSSYYQNRPKPLNPLETLSGVAGLQSTLNQNKLFQQEFNSKQGLSQIYKEAIDPNTGQLDPNKINRLLADPAASSNVTLGLPQAIQNSQEAQQRNTTIDTSKLENAQKHLQALTSYLAPLAQGNPTAGDIAATLAHANASGIASVDEIGKVWSSIPRDQKGQIDQSQIKPWVQQNLMRVMSAQEQLNATNPAPIMFNNGQQQIPMRLPQIGAPSQAGPGIQNQLPPTTPTFNQQTQQPGYLGSGGAGAVGGWQDGPGRGFVPSGPALGASAAADVASGGSAKAYQALRDDVGSSGARIFQLGKALTALEGTNTGPGTDSVNNVKSFLLAQSPDFLAKIMPGVDPNKIKNYDEANKYLTAYASGAAGAVGPHTDNQLATALSANASTKISNLAAKDVVKANIALEKMKQAAAIQFKNSGEAPQNFSDWYANYNKFADPRAFLADQQSAKERRTMIDKMNTKEQASYVNSFKAAVKSGVINLEDLPR